MSIPSIETYSFDSLDEFIKNRTEWKIDPKRAVFLVHDMQNYFASFYKQDEMPLSKVIDNISTLKAKCSALSIPIIYTAQPGNQSSQKRALLTDFWGPGLQDKQETTSIVEALKPSGNDICLEKWRYSAFQRTDLEKIMRDSGRDQLIITGIYAHIGILATALEAFMRDFKVFVVADAIADFSRKDHEMAISYISGRCGMVVDSNTVLQSFPARITFSLSKEQMLQDVLAKLELEDGEVSTSDNLMYAGLDSIQLMELVSIWSKSVPSISFSLLAEAMTIDEWFEIINSHGTLAKAVEFSPSSSEQI